MVWPQPGTSDVPFGRSGGKREADTNNCRAVDGHTEKNADVGDWLYDLSTDANETNNLAGMPEHADTLQMLKDRLAELATTDVFPGDSVRV